MQVIARNRKKFTKTPYFGDSRLFKIIDVNIPKKLVASACLCSGNPKSLSHLVSKRYRVVTDRQTELPKLIRAIVMLTLARKNF